MQPGNSNRRETDETVARLEVHNQYHGRGLWEHSIRLQQVEAEQRRQGSILTGFQDQQSRLARLEEAVRLVKLAAGILMLALASSGVMGGSASKIARLLLGSPI